MTGRMLLLLVVTVGFGALSAVALLDVGYMGILKPHFQSWGGLQVFIDLVILALLACGWMVGDGRKHGINPWPFVGITLVLGSFGPLGYLMAREWRRAGTNASV